MLLRKNLNKIEFKRWESVLSHVPDDVESLVNLARLKIFNDKFDLTDLKSDLKRIDFASVDEYLHKVIRVLYIKGKVGLCSSIFLNVLSHNSDFPLSELLLIELFLNIDPKLSNRRIESYIERFGFDSDSVAVLYAKVKVQLGEVENAKFALSKLDKNSLDHAILDLKLASNQKKIEYISSEIQRYQSQDQFSDIDISKIAEAGGDYQKCRAIFDKVDINGMEYQLSTHYMNFLYRNRLWGELISICRLRIPHAFPRKKVREVKALEKKLKARNLHKDWKSSEEIIKKIVGEKSNAYVKNKSSIKKVAIVIGSLGPGGAERQCINLCKLLIEKVKESEIESVVLYVTNLSRSPRDNFYLDMAREIGIEVKEYYDRETRLTTSDLNLRDRSVEFLDYMQPISRRQMIFNLYNELREYEPDVIHAWLDETIINASIVATLLGGTKVIGRWGSMPPCIDRKVTSLDRFNSEYQKVAYQSIAKQTFVNFTSNSRLTADAYANWMGIHPDEISIIYNGLNFQALSPCIDTAQRLKVGLGIAEHEKVVGIICRVSEEKQPFLWLELANKISKKLGCHFIMVGDGPQFEAIQSEVSKENLKNIHIVGRQSNVADWYSIFDVFLLTSSVEGVANVVIESQYMEVPVVAPDVGGLSEAILHEETGYLCCKGDVDDLAAKVMLLLNDDSLRYRMGKNGRRYAENKFSPNNLIANTLEAYRT